MITLKKCFYIFLRSIIWATFCHQLIVFPSHYDAHNELRVMFNLLSRFIYVRIANNVTLISVALLIVGRRKNVWCNIAFVGVCVYNFLWLYVSECLLASIVWTVVRFDRDFFIFHTCEWMYEKICLSICEGKCFLNNHSLQYDHF